jgi:uncharacterized protein YkwD
MNPGIIGNWLRLVVVMALCAACRKEAPVAANIKEEMLAAVNTLRTTGCTCGGTYMPPVQPLQWNDTLERAALAYASDMSANNYFSHISPAGTSPIQRAMALGYTGNYVTENIARGFSSLQTVMQGWQKSEDHCKAMMDPLQTDMGAGNVNTYWVQEFGSRR